MNKKINTECITQPKLKLCYRSIVSKQHCASINWADRVMKYILIGHRNKSLNLQPSYSQQKCPKHLFKQMIVGKLIFCT
jgi:hypothetical protein